MQDERLTYDVGTAAKLLGISRNSAYLACLTGQIPHLKIGKRILIPRASLAQLIESAGNGKEGNDDIDFKTKSA
jgi:excisionase family DNA binding protein